MPGDWGNTGVAAPSTGLLGQGGSFSNSSFSDFAGAAGDIFGTAPADLEKAKGDMAEGENYALAATLAGENAEFTVESTGVQEQQEARTVYKTISGQQADVAAAGIGASGTALDLLRDSAQQGAITKQMIGEQGLITEAGYKEQQQSYLNMESAAMQAAGAEKNAATTADITGGIKAAAGIAQML